MNLQGVVSKRVVAYGRLVARRSPNVIRNTRGLALASCTRSPLTTAQRSGIMTATTVLNNRAHWSSLRCYSSSTSDIVPVPSMGDSISEGTVVEWLKAPGDFVEADDVVVVLETDKVSVDVRAPFAGQLDEQLAKIDENVLVGAPLFKVTKKEGGNAPSNAATAVKPTPAASPSSPSNSDAVELVTVNVPSMGDSISEGTIVTVLKNVGDYVHADEPVLIVETDKVSVDVNAPFSGKLISLLTKLDDVVQVGAPLFVLDKNAVGAPSPPAASTTTTPPPTSTKESTPPKTSPAPTASTPTPPSSAPTTNNSNKKWNRNETRVQLSTFKIRAAQRQKDTQNAAAMLSTFQECDLGNLLAFREELGPEFEKVHGVPLGFLSTFLKASALALKQVPAVNSFLDMEAKEIVQNNFVDINVAVASSKGVVVPVIRNVEALGLGDIEKTLVSLSQQASEGSLAIEDLAGGTFTIHNAGVHGSFLSTSMLTSPQSAVLTIHGVKTRPALYQGKIVPRPMMYLTLTYDHRIIDGREGVTFLKSIADSVADPRRLLTGL